MRFTNVFPDSHINVMPFPNVKAYTFIYRLTHVHLQTAFVNIPAFICGFLTFLIGLDSQMHFFQMDLLCSLSDVFYNFSQSHEGKCEGMTEYDHISYLHSVQCIQLITRGMKLG